jgi:putative nucleotidyltransferase with HDIG domain
MSTIKVEHSSPAIFANRLGDQMEQIIRGRLDADQLHLPALSVTAARCLTIIRDPDFDTKWLVASIERDPALAAQLLKLAGSAAYNYDGGRVTVASAVVRLGASKMTTLILDAATRRLYESCDKRISAAARAIYEHSLGVALLARDLSMGVRQVDSSDTAYLCGLLHDVGKVVVAITLLEMERMICAGDTVRSWADSEAWLIAVERSHRRVGVALCKQWLFPPAVLRAVANVGTYDTAEPKSPANFVRFANAAAKKAGLPGGRFDHGEVEEILTIGRVLLELDDDLVARATDNLKERVRAQLV